MKHNIRYGILTGALGMALLSSGVQAQATADNPADHFQTTIQRALATLTELQHQLDAIHDHKSATLPANPWAKVVAQIKIGMTRAQVEALLRPMQGLINDFQGGYQMTTYMDAHTYMDTPWKVCIVYDFHGTAFSAISLMNPSNRVIGLPSLTQEAAPSLNLGPFHLSVKKPL